MAVDAHFEVRLAVEAEADLAAIADHLAEYASPNIADAWLEKFLETIASLERFPDRGSMPKELDGAPFRGYRQLHLRPYRIIYRTEGKTVLVAVIVDGRRDLKSLLHQRLLR